MTVRVEIQPSSEAFERSLARLQAMITALERRRDALAGSLAGGAGSITPGNGRYFMPAQAAAVSISMDAAAGTVTSPARARIASGASLFVDALPGPGRTTVTPPGAGPAFTIRPDAARYHDTYNLRSGGNPGSARITINPGQAAPFTPPIISPSPAPGLTVPAPPVSIHTANAPRPTAFAAPHTGTPILPHQGKGAASIPLSKAAKKSASNVIAPIKGLVGIGAVLLAANTAYAAHEEYMRNVLETGELPDPDHTYGAILKREMALRATGLVGAVAEGAYHLFVTVPVGLRVLGLHVGDALGMNADADKPYAQQARHAAIAEYAYNAQEFFNLRNIDDERRVYMRALNRALAEAEAEAGREAPLTAEKLLDMGFGDTNYERMVEILREYKTLQKQARVNSQFEPARPQARIGGDAAMRQLLGLNGSGS